MVNEVRANKKRYFTYILATSHKPDLFTKNIEPKNLYNFLQEIVDKVDTVNDATNKEFTQAFLPKLDEILKENKPELIAETPINGVRNVALKVLQKICTHYLPSEQLQQILNTLLEVVEKDNEDNALLGLQIIRDALQKSNASIDTATTEKIEKFIQQQFEGFKDKFNRNFMTEEKSEPVMTPAVASQGPAVRVYGSATASPGLGPNMAPPQQEADQRKPKQKTSSSDSFKVVAEVQIITLIAMVQFSRKPKPKIMELVPLIVSNLQLMPSKEMQLKKKDKFIDFLWAQSKMYSIISSLLRLRSDGDVLQKSQQAIADCSINFLKNCPPEHSNIRKAFLQTLKSFTTIYIDAYLKHFKDILDYNVLVGENNERQELRVEASNIILNVVQYTKDKLTTEQREWIIRSLLRMINDHTITVTLQGNAVLSLNKYIDIISKMPDSVFFQFCMICIDKNLDGNITNSVIKIPILGKLFASKIS